MFEGKKNQMIVRWPFTYNGEFEDPLQYRVAFQDVSRLESSGITV